MAGGDGAVARVTKAGEVTEFALPTPGDPNDIAVGPDGNLWYVDSGANVIGRITPTGSITGFTDGLTPSSAPTGITKEPDGAMWFTESATGMIGRITTAGVITEFSSGLSGSDSPDDIVKGPDGNLWFTLNADPAGIGRITPDGDITEYSNGFASILNPWYIAAGPDGNMWFTGNNVQGHVGRITLPPLVRDLTADQVAITSARLRGKVRPNSQATEYHFEYGLTDAYDAKTPGAYAGSGYDLLTVTAAVDGLAPGTKYHYRLVASNDSGTTEGPDRTFTTQSAPQAEPGGTEAEKAEPEFAKSVVVEPEGAVRVKTPLGEWDSLGDGAEVPLGAMLDTRRGRVALSSRGCHGETQTGRFGGGIFSVRQPRSGCGHVDVYLRGGNFKSCPRLTARHRRGRVAAASRVKRVRKLWGRDSGGRFRSHGRHSHATVRGTRWLTLDRCDGTLTRVTSGAVAVRDEVRHRTVLVRAGRSYLAKSRRALRLEHRRHGHR
jgi:hypothetical protein